jgi:hypothetical protein
MLYFYPAFKRKNRLAAGVNECVIPGELVDKVKKSTCFIFELLKR